MLNVAFWIGRWLVPWALFAGFYLALAGTWGPLELTAAVMAGGLAAGLGAWVRARSDLAFHSHPRWWTLLGRIIRHTARDCVVVGRAVGSNLVRRRHPAGEFRTIEFAGHRREGETEPEAAARRALVTIGVSLAPNSYVAVVDAEADRLVVHHLVEMRGTETPDRVWPL